MRLPAFVDPSAFCSGDAFHLSFSTKVRLELSEYAEHIEESLAGRRARVDRLFRRLQGHPFLLKQPYDRRLAEAFETARASSGPLSLLLIDVDHFKAYNDTYGHPAGDEVLRQVAEVLRSTCRGEMDLVARYGGEEFAVILPTTPIDVSNDIAVRLATAVRMLDIPHMSSSKGRVTVSVGLASLTEAISDPQHLLKSCDKALYAAKAAGRDKVRAAAIEDQSVTVVKHKSPR